VSNDGGVKLGDWDCNRFAVSIDPRYARLSRGFLRCRPSGWFPGFASQWQAVTHSLGGDLKILDIVPEPFCEPGPTVCYGATINNEPCGLLIDSVSEVVLLDLMLPFGSDKARNIALEYLARRLFATLAATWSGPSPTAVSFNSQIGKDRIKEAGAIRMRMNLNGQECTVWFSLGAKIVEQIDGLWRRQIRSTTSPSGIAGSVEVEIAQLAVPPQMIDEYTRAGTVIDLEVPLSDQVTLRVGGKPWLSAKLRNVGGKIALETIISPPAPAALPDGTARIGIQLGTIEVDPPIASEISQPGAVIETGWPLTADVDLMVNNEHLAEGVLKSFEGRLAVNVR
jgi:hypothetical protein